MIASWKQHPQHNLFSSRMKKFFSYYKSYPRLLLADLLCAFIVSVIAVILPLCAGYVTGNILSGDAPDKLAQIYAMGAFMLVLVALYTACNVFVDYQGHMMGAMMERDMRRELFDHYQKLSFGFYDDHKTGQLMSRMTTDVFWLGELFHHGPEDIAIAVFKFTGVFIVSLTINVELTLIIFAFLPFMGIYAFYFNKKMNIAMRKSKARIGDINAQVEDTLAGIRVVQSFTNEAVEREKFAVANNRFVDSRREGYRSEAYFYGGMVAFTQFMTIAIIIIGGAAIVNASLDLPQLITYLLYAGILIEPIQRLVNFSRLYQEGITGFGRFMEMLEVTPQIQEASGAVELTEVAGQITFENVSFRYEGGYEDILRNVSLEIDAGDYIALVGASGAGKTTFCSLIPRFYEINEGAILLDGVNIQDMSLHTLRQNIGIVQQDVYLFGGTVAENIRYGNLNARQEDMIAAAVKANAHEFIMALPDGYDTYIGQRGVKLSGGQKQRLSIARVFLKNPPIVIFDEATSSLDNASEKTVQAAMEALTKNRTTLVIAHRLSTIRNAERIIVLDEQGIAEQGTHDELMVNNGIYAELYLLQSDRVVHPNF